MARQILSNVAALALVLGLASPPALAGEVIATLELDPLSFVSFENSDVYAIPPGGTIVFRCGDPQSDGSIPFTIQPSDVHIPGISLRDGGTLTYRLAKSARGTISKGSEGFVVEFPATISADLSTPEGGGSLQYNVRFTTETAQARNLAGTSEVSVSGLRLLPEPGAVQLVGAGTSGKDAFPGPGKAVYTVLSGRFDQLPDLP